MAEPSEKKRFVTVGYALPPRHERTFEARSIFPDAERSFLDFKKIDSNTQWIDHPEYDCILHKISGDQWKQHLADYKSKNPNVIIIDAPEAIERLSDWIFVAHLVCESQIAKSNKNILGFPNQTVVMDGADLLNPRSLERLKFPMIVKPLMLDGTELLRTSVVFNHAELSQLTPPIVVQELSDGVIFTIHVAGEHAKYHDACEYVDGQRRVLVQTKRPPNTVVDDIAKVLREALNLSLFSFDMIRDPIVENRWLLVDINYFPMYSRRAIFEDIFAKFIKDLAKKIREMKA